MTGLSRRVYIAGPLFSAAERQFNHELAAFLRSEGHEPFLPQDSCLPFEELLASGMGVQDALRLVFEKDMEMLDACDLFLFVLDGRVPDEGACFEMGYAYAKGMDMVALKTDARSSVAGEDNAMISVPLRGRTAKDLPSLAELIYSL